VISLFVYVGAYGTLWLLKFAYLDRMLFRPVPPEPPTSTGVSVGLKERDSVLAGVMSDGTGAGGRTDAFGSE
jgi:hypothetical protein